MKPRAEDTSDWRDRKKSYRKTKVSKYTPPSPIQAMYTIKDLCYLFCAPYRTIKRILEKNNIKPCYFQESKKNIRARQFFSIVDIGNTFPDLLKALLYMQHLTHCDQCGNQLEIIKPDHIATFQYQFDKLSRQDSEFTYPHAK